MPLKFSAEPDPSKELCAEVADLAPANPKSLHLVPAWIEKIDA